LLIENWLQNSTGVGWEMGRVLSALIKKKYIYTFALFVDSPQKKKLRDAETRGAQEAKKM